MASLMAGVTFFMCSSPLASFTSRAMDIFTYLEGLPAIFITKGRERLSDPFLCEYRCCRLLLPSAPLLGRGLFLGVSLSVAHQ